MLMYKLLGKKKDTQAQAQPAKPAMRSEMKLLTKSAFGYTLLDTLDVQYKSREELRERVRRALNLQGVDAVRVADLEYTINNYGELMWNSIWWDSTGKLSA